MSAHHIFEEASNRCATDLKSAHSERAMLTNQQAILTNEMQVLVQELEVQHERVRKLDPTSATATKTNPKQTQTQPIKPTQKLWQSGVEGQANSASSSLNNILSFMGATPVQMNNKEKNDETTTSSSLSTLHANNNHNNQTVMTSLHTSTNSIVGILLPVFRDYVNPLVFKYLIPRLIDVFQFLGTVYYMVHPMLIGCVNTMRYVMIDVFYPIYQSHIYPRLLRWYNSYVEPIVLPFYQSYLAAHISTIYYFYMTYLSMYVQPIWLWIYHVLNAMVVTVQEGHLVDDTTLVLSNIYTTYEAIIASLCENPTIQNIFGAHVDVIVSLLGYLITISLLLLIRRMVLGVIALILFICFSPILMVVFLIGKGKKIIYGSSIKRKKVTHPFIRPLLCH